MTGLIPLFVVPEFTTDKIPTIGNQVVIEFHWQVLRRAVDMSVMSPKAP
jgi:hypothetical protein